MLDVQLFRRQPDLIRAAAHKRGQADAYVDLVIEVDSRLRERLARVEQLKADKNALTGQIQKATDRAEAARTLKPQIAELDAQIAELGAEIPALHAEVEARISEIPNLPDASTPDGHDESANIEVRRSGTPRSFAFTPRPHWEIGEELGILDFERATKLSGARFSLLRGAGAQLSRALVNFFLDRAAKNGYIEIDPPVLVQRDTMFATGQLSKFADAMFRDADGDLFLIPTAEVPLTALHREEILAPGSLPLQYAAATDCFRKEAGAAGRDTRGLIRLHQFKKVELVWLTEPEHSFTALESLTNHAAAILDELELPYRVMLLCGGDIGFNAAKTYDLEVWIPSQATYREISSCSNCTDFQSRRSGIRYRKEAKGKPEFVHTLNGSGLAVGRTLVAILENYQQADGSLIVPRALVPYIGQERISVE